MISEYKKNRPVASYSLEELLPHSLFSSPAVSIRTIDTVSDAASLLAHNLEYFTSTLVVTKDELPVGMIGGADLLDAIIKNPKFSDKTPINEIINNNLITVTKQTRLDELLKTWLQTKRAFAIIPNQYHGYSAISARKLLEIGALCKTNMKISNIPKKKIITFSKDHTIREVIIAMFENKTRKLILENTLSFISDRIITEKIIKEPKHLQNINTFLDMNVNVCKLENVKTVSNDLEIPEACKIMHDMLHPYLMTGDQVVSPWDIVLILGSKDLIDYQWQNQK
ncbi:MAG TPA: CBS domain-containing protein [Nitrosopumilaceae archaeon]|nr:CBS domain-containing protein [Nitrosopumilaceae archaeon]